MKKTQWIELFQTIKNTAVPFASIILFVAMGTAFLTGMSWASKSLGMSIEKDFEQYAMHDVEIYYPLGIDGEQLDVLKEEAGLSCVEGTYVAYPKFMVDDVVYQGKVASFAESIDKPHSVTGRLPEKCGEIAVEAAAAEKLGLKIGDSVTFMQDDYEKCLKTDTFTITATLEHPAYSGISERSYGLEPNRAIPVSLLFFVSENSFDETAFEGYVNILISCDELAGVDSLSEEFEAKYKPISERLYSALISFTLCNKQDKINELLEGTSLDFEAAKALYEAGEYDKLYATLSETDFAMPVISSRKYNSARNTIDVMAGIFSRMKYSVALMFLLVSMIICFFSIMRIVKSQRELIGIKRAMGFKKGEILRGFLVYSAIMTFAGCMLGLVLSRFVIEPVLVDSIKNSYVIENRILYFSLKDAVFILFFEMAVMLLVTYLSCVGVIKLPAVKLLNGNPVINSRTRFYEKTKWWNGLSLFSKTVVNNFMNDKKRVASTLFGIVGSTALVVCSVFIKNSIDRTFTHHFDAIEHYNTLVFFDSDVADCPDTLGGILNENNISYTMLYTSMGTIDSGRGDTSYVGFKVPLDEHFSEFVECHSAGGNDKACVWLAQTTANYMDINVGDEIIYTDARKSDVKLCVDEIMEFYMAGQLIISKEAFRELFGYEARANTFLLQTDKSEKELNALLSDVDGFIYVMNYDETRARSYGLISGVALSVVAVFLVLSVAMTVFVLLTLLVMFVEDKKREIIILMINGYSMKKVRKYIYLDTIWLTVLGTVLGVIAGEALGFMATDSLATQHSMAYKQLSPIAALTGVLCSAVFSYAASKIALKRIERFHLSDIN